MMFEADWISLAVAATSLLILPFHIALERKTRDQTNHLLHFSAFDGAKLGGSVILVGIGIFECAWSVTSRFIMGTLVYASFLGLISAYAWAPRLHLSAVLLVTWVVCAYQDVYPLTFRHHTPQVLQVTWTANIRMGVLTLIGLVLPMTEPRVYVPVHSKFEPSPEQGASWWSLIWFGYLDQFVWSAYRGGGLRYLPNLADTNAAETLFVHVEVLDPLTGKLGHRHIFRGLIHVIRYDIILILVDLVFVGATEFISPIGINRLLSDFETKESQFQPWFWILCIFLGPVLYALSMQRYTTVASGIMVRIQSILTQLLLKHSLRTRAKENSVQADGKTQSLVGRFNNLITTDMTTVGNARDWILIVTLLPIQILLSIVFLYKVLGWSAIIGISALVLLLPVPGQFTRLMQSAQKRRMGHSDERVQLVSEIVGAIRMIKLFAWESKSQERIAEKREHELDDIWKVRMFRTCNDNFRSFALAFITFVTFASHTVLLKQELNSSQVFSSIVVFDSLRYHINVILNHIAAAVAGKVGLDRIDEFLKKTELLDAYDATHPPLEPPEPSDIGFHATRFFWSTEAATDLTRPFSLNMVDTLKFKRGGVNLICGETGCGKTSLLMALLGEMHAVPLAEDSWYNLPRSGGVAYAAQESWVQSGTIRENILFGGIYDANRYQQVLYQCGLVPDIKLFACGDATEIGERGITLSGGQKARITLARAVYSTAEILLLDDILAALDVHTAKWVVEKCLSGGLVAGRTVLLVTHNLILATPIASFIVELGPDGMVIQQGPPKDVLATSEMLSQERSEGEHHVESSDSSIPHPEDDTMDKSLTAEEEIAEGHLTWGTLKLYLGSLGGSHPVLFFMTYWGASSISGLARVLRVKILGWWTHEYEITPSGPVSATWYSGIFLLVACTSVVINAIACLVFFGGSIRASRTIHQRLITSILNTTFRWHDVTPTSRIMTRCTQDISSIDDTIGQWFSMLTEVVVSMVFRFGAIVVTTPTYTLPGLTITLAGVMCGKIYMAAQLPVKREMSVAKAPILAHFSGAITGLTSVRAFGAQDMTILGLRERLDRHSKAAITYWNLNCWIMARSDFLGSVFTSCLALYLTYGSGSKHYSSSEVGFALSMAASFSVFIMYFVRCYNELELAGNSLERISDYLQIEQESPSSTLHQPAAWPTSGDLCVDGLTAQYSTDGPKVLHDLNFHIQSGERVGIVGRTGSGKSSLALSLMRAIPTTGYVYYDGVLTSQMSLQALRSHISIIPQIPEVLSGSLRDNLDPFSEYEDAMLHDAMRAAGLGSVKFTLDMPISNRSLSVGERQMIALARTLLRGCKILILDEATSAVDYNTDTMIQAALRAKLPKDTTVITIAHRLQTIMDADKIIVLDFGRIVEYGNPKDLLGQSTGYFKSLVEEHRSQIFRGKT